MTMGERIVILRKKKGLSQAALARQADVSQPALHAYERENRPALGMAVARAGRLASVLGVSVDYLMGRYEDEDVA